MLIAVLPLPERVGVRLMRDISRGNRLPVDGFAAAQAVGRSQGRKLALTAQIVYKDRRDYWINGLVPALVARMISEGKSVQPGLHYLADAVDPTTFVTTPPHKCGRLRVLCSFTSADSSLGLVASSNQFHANPVQVHRRELPERSVAHSAAA